MGVAMVTGVDCGTVLVVDLGAFVAEDVDTVE